MWFYDWNTFTLGDHAANFGGFNHCGRRDKKFLICHVISEDHAFKRLSDFIERSSLYQVTTLLARRLEVVET